MELKPFTQTDFDTLYDFMKPLWLDTYAFLPKAQVLFLLDKYFSLPRLKHYQEEGYRYYKIDDVGVLVFVEKDDCIYIDKLYLLPTARGQGYPEFVFQALSAYKKDILLNVNQNNARAVACYLKNGFIIDEKQEIVLGDGMINYDYVMRKQRSVAS